MRQVRRMVFETNSSSTHSVAFTRAYSNRSDSKLPIDEDGDMYIPLGEFGWEQRRYTDQFTKLSYLLTMVVMTDARGSLCKDEIYETRGFNLIKDAICEYCGCNNLHINSPIKFVRTEYNFYLDSDGYIDHQSCEDYGSVEDFLSYYIYNSVGKDAVLDFVFDESIVLITDNDNH